MSTVGTSKRGRKPLRLSDWLLLLEAAAAVTVASLAVATLPFRTIVAFVSRRPTIKCRFDPAEALVRRGCWAVEAVARRLPFRTVCFQKGLALYWMMRRRGVDVRLHYGVKMAAEMKLSAHVWISHEGIDVMGGEVAPDFACLATYPVESVRTARGGSL